jgi:hypothetical protein
MTTSNSSSSSSGQVAAAPIYDWEEHVPTAGSVLGAVPLIVVASAVEAPSRAGMPVSCPAPATKTWGPPSCVVPQALDPWGGGVTFGLDALESKSKSQ